MHTLDLQPAIDVSGEAFSSVVAHLETGSHEIFPKRLNGAPLEVVDQLRHGVMLATISRHHKLPGLTLVDHKVATPITTPAANANIR